jgi:rubrerythrin
VRRTLKARPSLIVVAAVLVLALLAGCGVGGDSTGGSGSTSAEAAGPTKLSKAEFIAQADGICKATNETQAPLQKQFEQLQNAKGPNAEKELGESMTALASAGQAETKEIRGLEPPKKDAAEVKRLLDSEEAALSVAAEAATALEEGDPETFYGLLETISAKSAVAQGYAEGYGLKVCGQ